MRVVLRAFVEHDVRQMRLKLLNPGQVLLSKLDCFLWVVLELDLVLVCSETFTAAKSCGDTSFSLLFPAASIAIDRRPIWIRFARNLNPSLTTSAVDS